MGTPFIEAIANEKSWETLHSDSPSAKLRRMMFRGQTIWPKTAINIGASKGLPGAVAANMQEWGFEFERIDSDDSGNKEKGFKLKNPQHVPTERKRKEYTQPRQRHRHPEQPVDDNKTAKAHGEVRTRIHEALVNGDALSDKECQRLFDCSAGNLRRVLDAMEKEGFTFDNYKTASGKTWVVKSAGKRLAKAGSNGHGGGDRLPVLFGHANGGEGELAVPPVPMFGGHVQVVGQHIGRDGMVSLVLRNEDFDWLVDVDRTLDAEAADAP